MPEQEPLDIVITCTACAGELEPWEIAYPGNTGVPELCAACVRELYQYTCCWCEEDDDQEYEHVLLVVFDPEAVWMPLPGLYRFDQTPASSQPMLGPPRLWDDCATWLGYLPACHADGDACGHLCRRCAAKALAHVLYDTRCGVAALAGGQDHA